MPTWQTTGEAVAALSGIDGAVQQYMEQNSIANAAVAITRGSNLVFCRGYTSGDGVSLTQPTSLFRIASCTKPLTRIGIYKLKEAGHLDTSTTVQSKLNLTLPDGTAPISDPMPTNTNTAGYYFPSVTVGDLLNHAGGWDRTVAGEPTFFHDPDVAKAFDVGLPVDRMQIARWGVGQQMQFWPGSKSVYSNFGFSVLGLVIEAVTGSSYIDWMKASILGPLGVARARLSMPLELSRAAAEVAYIPESPATKPDLVSGVGQVPLQYGGENNANFASFGGWVMAAPDYVKVLSSYTSATTAPTTTLPKDMLGNPRATYTSVNTTEHYGGVPGAGTYIALRDDDVAIALFFAKDGPWTYTSGGTSANLVGAVHQILNDLPAKSWPTGDQFPSVMTAPVPPGPERLNLVVTAADGSVQHARWEQNVAEAAWRGWWPVRDQVLTVGQPVSVVSRDLDKLDIFAADSDSRTYTAAWDANVADASWRGWWNILTGAIPAGGSISAVSRDPEKLDLFLVSTDGGVYTAAWDQNVAGGWRGWWRIGDLRARPGSPVAAVSRDPGKLDVFVAGDDGKTYTAAWDQNVAGGWRGWWNILTGAIPAGGSISAVSRDPEKLDVFLVSTDGGVYTAAWDQTVAGGWRGWWRIGNLQAHPGAPVGVVVTRPA
jgi:CubicO group peptidase (beta-lactamase class C family)